MLIWHFQKFISIKLTKILPQDIFLTQPKEGMAVKIGSKIRPISKPGVCPIHEIPFTMKTGRFAGKQVCEACKLDTR